MSAKKIKVMTGEKMKESLLRWSKLSNESRCVITGCDIFQELMLPWWYDNLRRHSQLPLIFVDMGLSRKGPSPEAAIFHWWGMAGKEDIRQRVAVRPAGDSWRALEEGSLTVFRRGLLKYRRKWLHLKFAIRDKMSN